MKEFSDFDSFARHLQTTVAKMGAAEQRGLEKAGRLIEREAKKKIGRYQDAAGPFAAWAWLADSTLRDKERKGYAPPDNPLLREGDLRDSIEHTTEINATHIGSNSDIAVYQELGTRFMPPRSFLGSTGAEQAEKVVDMIGGTVTLHLAGHDVFGGSMDAGPDRSLLSLFRF